MRRHGSMMVVLSGLLAASLAIGLPVGSAYADEPTDGTGAGTSATEVLDSLEVKGRAPKTGYKRTQFGKAWADVDHNGCDTRNDILNRDLTGSFGSKKYAFEEMIAEQTAAFSCAALGIVPTVRHADYIGSWLEVMREDSRAIVRAASQASKAADWLLSHLPVEEIEEPDASVTDRRAAA